MNILITSPRAPVVLDWMRVFADADKTVLCDSLRFPLAAFAARSNPRVRYCRIPPPRYDFAGYAAAMRGLVAEADFVVPPVKTFFISPMCRCPNRSGKSCLCRRALCCWGCTTSGAFLISAARHGGSASAHAAAGFGGRY